MNLSSVTWRSYSSLLFHRLFTFVLAIMSLLAQEKNSSKGVIQLISENKNGQTQIEVRNETKISKWSSLNQAFAEIFLPRGYPDSVCADYLSYQIWDSLQAYGSSITGTLATHNVLKGMGVGDKSASVMSATLTWLLKDGTGMVGRIAFTYFKGSNLDVDCKKWRLFADIINDIAIGLDMICPFFSGYLLILQCSSGFLKSLVGTIGGATRAALTQHQARNNNLADVSAKDASQETLVNLAALLTSLAIVPLVAGSDLIVWTLFVILTMIHIYCNYRAVRSVNMEIFNPARFTSFVEEYIFMEKVGSIDEINRKESILFFSTHEFQEQIKSGVALSDHFIPDGQLTDFLEYHSTKDYILSFDFKRSNNILISFIENQDSVRNKLKAYFHANLILFYLFKYKAKAEKLFNFSENISNITIVSETEKIVNQKFEKMLTDAIGKGWKLDNFIFLENGWRITQLYKKKFD